MATGTRNAARHESRSVRTAPRTGPARAARAQTQLLTAMTVAPWRSAGLGRRLGRLSPGFAADLVVLDRDPFATPPDELGAIGVVATMVGGRWVHGRPPW